MEVKDCSHYVPVAELFGFLNLDRFPSYNGVTGGLRRVRDEP
ncbi:MAG: hypothetical protein U0529_08890 [Thermoanaerobaculia bacterium]